MLPNYYTSAQVAKILSVSTYKIEKLISDKLLGCSYVGSSKRISEAHVAQYLKDVASRPRRKNRPRPPIPADPAALDSLWTQMTTTLAKHQPFLGVFLPKVQLTGIDTAARTAFLATACPDTATGMMRTEHRYPLQRHFKAHFRRNLKVSVTCSN